MVLHWQGGDHTAIKLKKNGVGKHRWTIPEDTLSLVRELARLYCFLCLAWPVVLLRPEVVPLQHIAQPSLESEALGPVGEEVVEHIGLGRQIG